MATIKRSDLVRKLRENFGINAAEASRLVEVVFDEITGALIRGEDVKITGLGTFKILHKPERIGRNPKTGVPAVISARRVTTFRPCAEFRQRVSKRSKNSL